MIPPSARAPRAEHRGTRAVQRMVEYAPATGGLALWMRHVDVGGDEVPGPAANDGGTVYYAPGFEGLSLDEQTGLVAHQVLHVALRHVQRLGELERVLGDVDRELFNVCADAIVNSTLSHLSWLRLPRGSVELNVLLERALEIREPVEKSLLEWDVERLYRAVDDRDDERSRRQSRRARSGAQRPGAGQDQASREAVGQAPRRDGRRSATVRMLGRGTRRDLLPSTRRERPEAAAEATREWSERISRGHAGDGEFSMLRALIADTPRTRTPWQQVLRTRLARGLMHQPDLSWSRPARSWLANRGRSPAGRRLPWEPGRVSSRAVPRLALVLDVSGSIEDGLLRRFASEVDAVTRRVEATITLIAGDDQVRLVREQPPGDSGLAEIQLQGGGGTDFRPLLAEAARHAPDLAVVLTDLQGPAGDDPGFEVLWALPPEFSHVEPPFGRALLLRD